LLREPQRLFEVGNCSTLMFTLKQAKQLEIANLVDMAWVLSEQSNCDRLVHLALETPLGDLKTFLSYARQTDELKPVWRALAAALAKPENKSRLAKRVLEMKTPLSQLASFLAYVEQTDELKLVFASLVAALAKPENQLHLAERALEAPLNDLKILSGLRSANQ